MAADASPEKNVPIFYGPTEEWPKRRIVAKFFEDPDFVYLDMDEKNRSDRFNLLWATEFSAVDALHALETFIAQYDLKKGAVSLKHTFPRQGYLMGGSNMLRGDAEDIIDEVYDNSHTGRVCRFSFWNKQITLDWGPAWPKTFHDLSTNEVYLHLKKVGTMSRMLVDQCMADTALPGLRSSIDVTLDEFSEYQPQLARS